jgi:hypothetical protein
MDEDCNAAQATLAKLRQGALLLTFAEGYLCEPPFLKKIGREMGRALQALPGQIESLKSRFPGKFENKLNIDSLVTGLHQKIKQLGDAEAEICAKCSQGDLGRELELAIGNLAAALNSITAQVEGRSAAHSSGKGSATLLVRSLQFMIGLISGTSRKLITILLPILVIAGLLFGYLFFTMEREEEIRTRIANTEAQAHSYRTILKEIERQKDQLSLKMDSIMKKELHRSDKIELIDLGQELHGIGEKQIKVETEIQKCGEELGRLNAKLRDIQRKSFLERLLKL